MYEIKNFQPRFYQNSILETCKNKNSLIILSTGLGKTKSSILVAIHRLNLYPDSKVLFLTPTKPLALQITEEFKSSTTIPESKISLLTGSLPPTKRAKLWELSTVIIATPQTISKDIEHKRIDLAFVSLLIIDEAHRSRARYANTLVAKSYQEYGQHQRIIALTASPGSSRERIKEICSNLNIEAVEIRTEDHEEVLPYIQEKKQNYIYVELPTKLKEVHSIIEEFKNEKLKQLEKYGVQKPPKYLSKKDLLQLQSKFRQEIENKNPVGFAGVSLTTLLIKLDYALELLETQTLFSLDKYFSKLETETVKASKAILNDERIQKAILLTQELLKNKIDHPKLEKLIHLIKDELSQNPKAKIIVFANYRSTVADIVKLLKGNGIKAKRFVGQADREDKGLKQDEQAKIIQEFSNNKFNILVASSVGEEGIDIGEVSSVIFYEPIPSELRRVQRSGRTGRTIPGKVFFLITKGTRDEAYFWTAHRKEKRMKSILTRMQQETQLKLQ